MKIYLVTRTDDPGYDEYDSWVVRAESEHAAKKVTGHNMIYLKVEEVSEDGEEIIILGSFNAG